MLKDLLRYVFAAMPSSVFALIKKGFFDRIPLTRAADRIYMLDNSWLV
jgi:hypothetical protein